MATTSKQLGHRGRDEVRKLEKAIPIVRPLVANKTDRVPVFGRFVARRRHRKQCIIALHPAVTDRIVVHVTPLQFVKRILTTNLIDLIESIALVL